MTQINLYQCPIADQCKSLKCGHRVPHFKEKRHDGRGRSDYCDAIPPYCPDCQSEQEICPSKRITPSRGKQNGE